MITARTDTYHSTYWDKLRCPNVIMTHLIKLFN